MLSQFNTAIFVCDVQGCFVKTIHAFNEVESTTSFLLQGARILNLPCIITEQYPERLQHTVDSLQPLIQGSEGQSKFPVFSKVDFSMCTDEVMLYIKDNLPNVSNIIICGLETHVCVYQTCVELMRQGFNVYICVDAVSSRSPIDRKVAIRQLEKMGANLTTSENVMFQFIESKNHSEFRSISSLVKAKQLPSLLGY